MLRQVFVINKELGMGKGKIAVQAAHGEVFYMNYLAQPHSSGHTEFFAWMKDGAMKKVVLKATLEEMRCLAEALDARTIWYHIVYDLGLTQIPANSATCLVVEPLDEALTSELFGHLTLLWSS